MLKRVEGSRAVAEAVALCRPEVICAYPISPQTHIVEALGEIVKSGQLAPCEFVNVESEFAAMSVAISASAAGARAYTATASQGLLFMAEALFNASGLGLPIVMTVANRAIGAPINIWNDHTDSMSQRDCGWIQLFAETNQEALDLHIQAFRLAEELSLPVMVCMDGFILTHAYERVDVPTQAQVDAYLPVFVIALGSVLGTLKDTVDDLRDEGLRIGVLGISCFRPWPTDAVRAALAGAKRVVVLEKSLAVGVGGIVSTNVRTTLTGRAVPVYDVIAGLGGRAITKASLAKMLRDAIEDRMELTSFLDLDRDVVARVLQREKEVRRSGPLAENVLRETGPVASRSG